MTVLLIAALVIYLIGAIRSKDLLTMVIAIAGLALWLLSCLGMLQLPACLTR